MFIRRLRQLFNQRTRHLSDGEVAVLTELLRGDDIRLRKFRQQWLSATGFRRCFGGVRGDSYEVSWDKSFPSLGHRTLESSLRSNSLTLVDAASGRKLSFRMVVKKGGICSTMIGTAVDGGPWPLSFNPGEIVSESDDRGAVEASLPDMADQDAGHTRLLEWMGLSPPVDSDVWCFVEVFEPVSKQELEELSQRIGTEVPKQLQELLSVSNGLLLGELYMRPAGQLAKMPREYGPANDGIVIADDFVNAIRDGFHFMPLAGPHAGQMRNCDMYGEQSDETIALSGLMRREFARLPLRRLQT